MKLTADRERRFYLNTAHPAPCNGTVNSWRYCFYNPSSINTSLSYSMAFAVYREVVKGDSMSYQRVSDVTRVTWSGMDIIRLPDFNCYNVSVNNFTIQVGTYVSILI